MGPRPPWTTQVGGSNWNTEQHPSETGATPQEAEPLHPVGDLTHSGRQCSRTQPSTRPHVPAPQVGGHFSNAVDTHNSHTHKTTQPSRAQQKTQLTAAPEDMQPHGEDGTQRGRAENNDWCWV